MPFCSLRILGYKHYDRLVKGKKEVFREVIAFSSSSTSNAMITWATNETKKNLVLLLVAGSDRNRRFIH
jgi:hypothetical protein